MSLFSRLFGGKSGGAAEADADPPEEYKGFRITPRPIPENGQFRVSALIERDGRSHELIRADTMASREDALAISLAKARQMIDQQGARLFGD